MELGGNGPTVVLQDADLELAAARVAWGAFTNAGQICTATERVIVHEAVADELASRLSAIAAQVVLGHPLAEQTTMGPVHTKAVAEQVVTQVRAAERAGQQEILWTYTHPYDFDREEKFAAMPHTPLWVSYILWAARRKAEGKIRHILALGDSPPLGERLPNLM